MYQNEKTVKSKIYKKTFIFEKLFCWFTKNASIFDERW